MDSETSQEVLGRVLPPALEVLTAWSIADGGDRAVFHAAVGRVLSDAEHSEQPLQAMAELLFGLSALSGILLDELAASTDRARSEVLQAVHTAYLDAGAR